MKRKNQNTKTNSGLPNRPEQSSKETAGQKRTLNQNESFKIHYKERDANRMLSQNRVLASMKRWLPKQRKIASVVGNWIWISFREIPSPEIRRDLSQLGFHWNNKRQLWQHPCGLLNTGGKKP
jgi:hypothetical protein